jgi:hypothetical protein
LNSKWRVLISDRNSDSLPIASTVENEAFLKNRLSILI